MKSIKDNTILNIDIINEELNNAEIHEDYDNPGQFIQTIYLGSILNLTPSGKIYIPWASSTIYGCNKCKGTGQIKNRHSSIKKIAAINRKIRRITNNWIKPYSNLTDKQMNLIDKLRKIQDHYEPMRTCPECCGLGSLEARLDEDWWNQLQRELDTIDAWHHGSDGDGCDIFISRVAADQEETW